MMKSLLPIVPTLILSVTFAGLTQANGEGLKPAEIKLCFSNLEQGYGVTQAALPGMDLNAVAIQCQGAPRAKLSSDFSEAEIKKGAPILATQSQIIQYVTESGFWFAEYPSFFYFVFYHDAADSIDVGVLPNHVMPLRIPNHLDVFVIQEGRDEGKTFPMSSLDSYASSVFGLGTGVKARTKYLDRYRKFLADAKLPMIELKAASTLGPERSQECIRNQVRSRIWNTISRSGQTPDLQALSPEADSVDAEENIRNPDRVASYKAKYSMSPADWTELYVKRAKAIPGCGALLQEGDAETSVKDGIAPFLTRYERAKAYIDRLP